MATREQFALEMKKRMGFPWWFVSKRALVTWMQAEGSRAAYNPLATTKRLPGSTNFNSVGVQNYVSLYQGVQATVATLNEEQPGYKKIRRRLRFSPSAKRIVEAVGDSTWGTSKRLLLEVLPDVKKNYKAYANMEVSS